MPLGGVDTRYDLSWEEQDKIRRRLEIKNRLKEEGIRKRYSPFLSMKGEIFSDPAIDRYMDLRKRGRMPNTPLKPVIFYGMVAFMVVPMTLIYYGMNWEIKDYHEGCASGEIPYEKRRSKALG